MIFNLTARKAAAAAEATRAKSPAPVPVVPDDQPDVPDQDAASYFADRPVTDPAGDRFTRWPFAQRIAETVAARREWCSLVIGLYGPWGDGKTTVLAFIKHRLRSYSNTIPVMFNPWRSGDRLHLTMALFKLIEESVTAALPKRRKELTELFARYAALAHPATVQNEELNTLDAPLSERFSSAHRESIKDRIESILREEQKRVVVMVDDIDRLDHDTMMEVFRLVRLSGDFDFCTYIMALDDAMVAEVVGARFGHSSPDPGRSFLEKIVQVPLKLPTADRVSLRRFAMSLVDEAVKASEIDLSPEECQQFVRHFSIGLEARLQTPRMAKRYGNALSFALPLLKDDVNHVDLMLIEGLRVFFPTVYQVVQDHPDVVLGTDANDIRPKDRQRNHRMELLEGSLTHYTREQREAALHLLAWMFPQVRVLVADPSGRAESEKELARNKRIASRQFFKRYFAYSLSENEISERDIDRLLGLAESKSESEVLAALKRMIGQPSVDALISRLLAESRQFTPEVSRKLVLGLARCGELLPAPEGLSPLASTFSQAALLVSQLLRNERDPAKRAEIAASIVDSAEPITFCAECFGWIHGGGGDGPMLEPEDEDRLGRLLAERIAKASEKLNLIEAFPHYIVALLFIWSSWRSRDETNAFIAEQLAKAPERVVPFVRSYLPRSVGLGGSSKAPSEEFGKNEYEAIKRVVEPDIIADAFNRAGLSNGSAPHNADAKLARQFSAVHRRS